MRQIALCGLAGWAGIVALAWWLADRRLSWCADPWQGKLADCNVAHAMETRDNVLVWGAVVALMAILIFVAATRYVHSRGERLYRRTQPLDQPTRDVGGGKDKIEVRQVSANDRIK